MIRAMLVLAALSLGGLLAYQWSQWPPQEAGQETPVAPASGILAPDSASEANPMSELTPLDTLESYAAVTEQTLFRPERRPPDPEEEEPGEGEEEPEEASTLEGMDLTAVIITPKLVRAWIKDPEQPEPVDLTVGEELAGWSVKEIRADRVVLERQGETNTLKLRDFSATQAPAGRARPGSRGRTAGKQAKARQGAARSRNGAREQQPAGRRRITPPRPPTTRAHVRSPLPQRPK